MSESIIILVIGFWIFLYFVPEEDAPEQQPIIEEKIIIDESLTNELKEQLELLNEELDKLKNIITSKDNEFNNLEKDYYNLKEQLAVFKNMEEIDISSYEKEIQNLKDQLQQRNVEIIDDWS